MFVSILLLCFILIFLCLYQGTAVPIPSGRGTGGISPADGGAVNRDCWRTCFLSAALIWGVLAALGTELLSLFHSITFGGILGFWILAAITAGIILLILLKKRKVPLSLDCSPLSISDTVLLSGIVFIVIITGLIALAAPPNNWDSLSYHMSRVVHWIQNHSVAHYPTNILRQLTYTPWAEFAMMHLQILSHGDRFANLVQWFSMTGSIIGVSLIAKQLGSRRPGQIMTSVIAATIPMGILQGSSTQNDYVVTFWLICFVYYLLLLKTDLKAEIYSLAAGVSLGLAVLTKGTAYIYAFPFLIWFACAPVIFCRGTCAPVIFYRGVLTGFKKYQRKLCKPLLTIFLAALIINSGYYARNFNLTKTMIPPSESTNILNKTVSFPSVISNIIHNTVLHLGTPFEKINTIVEKVMYRLHAFLGIAVTDPRTAFGGKEFHFPGHPFHEDHAGNLLHLALIIACTLLFLTSKHRKERRNLTGYLITIAAAALLFNLFLKWTPFHSRYHLPLFVLCAPFIGVTLSKIRDQKTTMIIGVILLLSSLPWLFYNQSRPLLKAENVFNTERIDQYFANNPGFQYSYVNAARYIKSQGCSQVGLALGANSWEYPLWVLLKGNNNPDIRLEHVNVQNVSSSKANLRPFSDFDPCAIINDNPEKISKIISGNSTLSGTSTYVKTKQMAFLGVFMKDPTGILAKKSLVYHFNKIMEYSKKANSVVTHGKINGVLDRGTTRVMLRLRQKQLKEARHIDIHELNRIHDGLGDSLKSRLVKGLELLLEGYAILDQHKYADGQTLLMEWNSWIRENRETIAEALGNAVTDTAPHK